MRLRLLPLPQFCLALLLLTLTATGCDQSVSGPSAGGDAGAGSDAIKIGFLVKQPEEPWFQLEWQFAEQAAEDLNFDLIKLAVPDGEKTLTAIDNLAVQGAGGFVICTPDVRLGPAIKAKAAAAGLKVISVDDRFIGPDGAFLDVPYVGISARKIGAAAGEAAADAMTQRGWLAADAEPIGVCVVTYDELDTIRERTEGAADALKNAGFPEDKIFYAAQKTADVPGGFDAANILLTQHSGIKHWGVLGGNDNAVLGAIRAMEGRGFDADAVIGVGINGSEAIDEFKKSEPTGLYASIMLSARTHGYETAEAMYRWLADGTAPAAETFTNGRLITRENFRDVAAEEGVTVD